MKEQFQQYFSATIFHQSQRFYGAFKKIVFQGIRTILHPVASKNIAKVYVAIPELTNDKVEEIKRRCQFYIPNLPVETVTITRHNTLPNKVAFAAEPLLKIDNKPFQPSWIYAYRQGIFNVDYLSNPEEGYEWHKLINFVSPSIQEDVMAAQHRLLERVNDLCQKNYDKCYIFGTGPSLATAGEKDWSDGYRIVCNTVVKDRELWQHLNPHFIVAADTIYHFGFTPFARTFREDLAKRLSESETYFVYPSLFHNLVKRYFKDFSNKLIPVPIKFKKKKIHTNLTADFSLPSTGNILPLLLLPLACTLSKNVYLFGFDGRAPNDQLFWQNSSQHTYSEYMEDLQKAHPAFFEYHVPNDDKNKYVNSVHGDLLEQQLTMAENEGWQFVMMHKSWTPTLQKRYQESTTHRSVGVQL